MIRPEKLHRQLRWESGGRVPQNEIENGLRSGRIFLDGEAGDPLFPKEISLLGTITFFIPRLFPMAKGVKRPREILPAVMQEYGRNDGTEDLWSCNSGKLRPGAVRSNRERGT